MALKVDGASRFAPDEAAAIGRLFAERGFTVCLYCQVGLAVEETDGELAFECAGCGRAGAWRAVVRDATEVPA